MAGRRLAALCAVLTLWAAPAGAVTYDILLRGTIESYDPTNGTLGSLAVGSVVTAHATAVLDPYLTNVAGSGLDLLDVDIQFSGGAINWANLFVPDTDGVEWGHIEPGGGLGPIIYHTGPQMILSHNHLLNFGGHLNSLAGPNNVALFLNQRAYYTEVEESPANSFFSSYTPVVPDPHFYLFPAQYDRTPPFQPIASYVGRWDYARAEVFIDGVRATAPEPSTWALAIVGFGLVGGAFRLRRQEPARLAESAKKPGSPLSRG